MNIQPSFEEFASLAQSYRVIPVWRSLLGDQVTPVAIFARCVGDSDGFLLESVDNGERWSRCLLYTSPSPRDATLSRMPSSA